MIPTMLPRNIHHVATCQLPYCHCGIYHVATLYLPCCHVASSCHVTSTMLPSGIYHVATWYLACCHVVSNMLPRGITIYHVATWFLPCCYVASTMLPRGIYHAASWFSGMVDGIECCLQSCMNPDHHRDLCGMEFPYKGRASTQRDYFMITQCLQLHWTETILQRVQS